MKKYIIFLMIGLWIITLPINDVKASPNVGNSNLFRVLGQGFFDGYYPVTAT